MIVEHRQPTHYEAGLPIVEIEADGILVNPDHPKHVIPINMHIIVMDLLRNAGRSDRTGIKVQSDKGECSMMELAIGANEFALAESHIGLVGEAHRFAGICVSSGTASSDVRETNKSAEIGYLARVTDVTEGH